MKRNVLSVIAAVGVALLFAGCASEPQGSTSEGARLPAQIVVGTAGGFNDELIKQYTIPLFNEIVGAGAPEVILDGNNFIGRPTQVVAEAGGAKGTFDAFMVTDTGMARLIAADALQKLDTSKIDRWDHVLPSLQNEYCVPDKYSAEVVIYNEEHVDTPDSWEVLWDPKYSGKIGVVESMYQYAFFAASAIEAGGEPGDDWVTPAKDRIAELGPNVRVYGSPDQAGQALATGEIWMTYNRKARAALWSEFDPNSPIKSVVPSEGTMPTTFYYCMSKNAQNPEMAYAWMNAVLDPSSQVGISEGMGYAPVIDDAQLADGMQEQIGFTDDELARIWSVDFSAQQEQAEEQARIWQENVVNR